MVDVIQKNKSKLLVVVPDVLMDEVSFARRARILAESKAMDIHFLGKIDSSENEPRLRRRLVTLSAIAGCGTSQSNFSTFKHQSWTDILTREFFPGDMILCPSMINNESINPHEFERVREQFGSNLVFSSGIIQEEKNKSLKSVTVPVIYWTGILIIIVAAFFFEFKFGLQSIHWLQLVGQLFIVIIEVLGVYAWHRLVTGRNAN